MNKTYKGYELIEAIANKKIKNYTKIIPHYPNNSCTVEYFEYSNGFIHDDKHSNDVNVCVFLSNDRTFEIVEDNTEEIEQCDFDISKVFQDLDIVQVSQFTAGIVDKLNEIIDEVNELVKEVNSINKEIK